MPLPFLNGQSKRRDQIVAVDLGARLTKAVHLQYKNNRYNLLSYTIHDAINQEETSVQALAEHLKSVTAAFSERTKHVTLALGVADTFLRHAELPLMPVADMRQMLKLNSKNCLQQDLPDHVFDCNVIVPRTVKAGADISKMPAKQKVLVAAAKRKTVDDLQAAALQAGLIPHQVIPGLVGPANAFELAEPEIFAKEVVALVDIGFKNTTIIMLQQGELLMNRVVSIGGDRLTTGLSESMGISYAEAEGIKIGMASEVQQNLEALVMPLGRELRASIDFFEHQHDTTVSHIFVAGGSARGNLIVAALQSELMAPCKTWDPTKSLILALPPHQVGEIEQLAPHLAVALGAAAASLN